MCTIVTPFGKYKYTRLPMGLKCSLDFAQEVMENVLRGNDNSDIYLDDIGAFSNTWEHHMELLDEILDRLTANGFTARVLIPDRNSDSGRNSQSGRVFLS